jgi:Zn-dependent protease
MGLLSRPWPEVLQLVIIIVISLTVHEYAHSLAALRLGDDTPRRLGRLTLNPLKHLDPVGFILLLVAGFGWAKPVIINPVNLKKPRRDEILISLAGPVSNLLFAMLAVGITWVVFATDALVSPGSRQAFGMFMVTLAEINVSLAVFNMIPIPPLDGSHLVTPFLGKLNVNVAATYFRYGSFLLLAVIIFQNVTHVEILPIGRVTYAIVVGMLRVVGLQ